MSGLLPIDPADFPDVPTKKALIAIDLQNDFLAEDGALPVTQPDGMVDNIARLAAAVRDSGYGEVVWVRSQFDTNRAVGEQELMATDNTELPARPGASAAATAARTRTSRVSPPELTPLEADPEAILSIASGQPGTGEAKPECVRKGTRGVEFLPAIAAAKGPRDYAMTKSYYSAFQSGQLLNLLRRHFATELYICGALCNVSVYATALAASSYGFDITIVEDCCGYRSEVRSMNAREKLTELTGCEFSTTAEIIPTLKPKPSPEGSSNRPSNTSRVASPAHIPSELIAAAMARKGRSPSGGGQGISVRPKSSYSPATPPADARSSTGDSKKGKPEEKLAAALPPTPAPDDLAPHMEKLKLNAAESTGPVNVSVAAHEKPQPGPAQPPAEPAVQPVVKAGGAKDEDTASQQPRANAQEHKSGPDVGLMEVKSMMAAIEASRHESQPIDTTGPPKVKENKPTSKDKAAPQLVATTNPTDASPKRRNSDTMATADFIPTEELLTADTPKHLSKGQWPIVRDELGNPAAHTTQPSTHKTENTKGVPDTKVSDEDTSKVAKDNTTKSTTSEPFCEGDTTITNTFLPSTILSGLFERLFTEVHFQKMKHQGGEVPRFVAVQGAVAADGTQPVYRHPSDETLPCVPFTPAVQAIREEVEKQVGHEMNHVLIQCYRGGNDYISEHSDKTLDIVDGSYIANVSLGAERTMVLRTKRDSSKKETITPKKTSEASGEKDDTPAKDAGKETSGTPTQSQPTDTSSPSKRQTVRIPMPHNSLLQMGLATNAKWLHGIRPDKRPLSQRSSDELAFSGYRISLTFRHIGTFLSPTDNPDEPLIWGQGAVAKAREDARPVVNGQTDQAITMLKTFGKENNDPSFSRQEGYARGFDVLHMRSASRYFMCGDTMVDGRVRIALAELGIKYAHGSIGTGKDSLNSSSSNGAAVVPVKYVPDDADRTAVTGDAAILLYLDARYPRKRKGAEAEIARMYTRFHAAVALGFKWKALWPGAGAAERRGFLRTFVRDDMAVFDGWLAEAPGQTPGSGSGAVDAGGAGADGASASETGNLFLAGGSEPSIADYAFWPVMQDVMEEWRKAEGVSEEMWGKYTALEKYYFDFSGRKSVVSIFGEGAGAPDAAGKKQGGHGDIDNDSDGKQVKGDDGPGEVAGKAEKQQEPARAEKEDV